MSQLMIQRFPMVALVDYISHIMLQYDVALVSHSMRSSCALALGGLALRYTALSPLVEISY